MNICAITNFKTVFYDARKITERKDSLLSLSPYLVCDAYFSKKYFTDEVSDAGLYLISRLRNDADLRYLYLGEQSSGRGRPKKYDGKIDFNKIENDKLEKVSDIENEKVFYGKVYAKSLKRIIALAIVYTLKKGKWTHKLYFSTDTKIDWCRLLELYRLRFQIEFLFRDAKHCTGLNDGQSRCTKKMNYHYNMSLSSLNIAKVVHWLPLKKE